MKNEMPSPLLDAKLCFIRFPLDTLQNFWQKKNHSHHHQGFFFFFSFLSSEWVGESSRINCSQIWLTSQRGITTIKLDRKVEKYKNSTTCWRHASTFCIKYGNIGPFLFFLKAFIPFATTFSLSLGCNCPKKH